MSQAHSQVLFIMTTDMTDRAHNACFSEPGHDTHLSGHHIDDGTIMLLIDPHVRTSSRGNIAMMFLLPDGRIVYRWNGWNNKIKGTLVPVTSAEP